MVTSPLVRGHGCKWPQWGIQQNKCIRVIFGFELWMIFTYQLKTVSLPSRAREMFITLAEPLRKAKHVRTGQQWKIANAQSFKWQDKELWGIENKWPSRGGRGSLILGEGGGCGMEAFGNSSGNPPQQRHLWAKGFLRLCHLASQFISRFSDSANIWGGILRGASFW